MVRTKTKNQKASSDQRGVILVSVMAVALALTIVGFSLVSFGVSHLNIVRANVYLANATQVAEAGIEQSLYQLNIDDNFAGYPTEQVFFDNDTQGRGVFTTVIEETEDSNAKTIISTGKLYRQNDLSNPESTRIIKATAVGTSSDGYSVHTGIGGLILSGSANITNSDVFVNGKIEMTGSAKIGTHNQPVHVNVANMACPPGNNPGPTYPQVCASGDPISMAWSTNIYGTVCATGQTSTGPNPAGNILPGVSGLGLQLGCIAPPSPMPSYDRVAHISRMTTTDSGSSNTYVCNNWPFDRNWPANLRLNGNVTIGGSCNVVLNGDVYITGNLTINGAARVTVSDSVGGTRPMIVADGDITLGGSAQLLANSEGTGIHFISYRTNAACNPNCTSLSGNALKNSQDLQTVTVGGGTNLPGMVFHSYWGKVRIGGSGNVGAAIGQTVDMSGAGTVTFGTVLSSGSKTWTLSSYQQVFD